MTEKDKANRIKFEKLMKSLGAKFVTIKAKRTKRKK